MDPKQLPLVSTLMGCVRYVGSDYDHAPPYRVHPVLHTHTTHLTGELRSVLLTLTPDAA